MINFMEYLIGFILTVLCAYGFVSLVFDIVMWGTLV